MNHPWKLTSTYTQLRFFTPEGKLVPTPEEIAERMSQKLKELGIDPSSV